MILLAIVFILVLTIFGILICNFYGLDQQKTQRIALGSSVLCFFLSTFLWITFDRTCAGYQFVTGYYNYLFQDNHLFLSFANKFIVTFGVDGISLFFIILSTFIIPLCLLTSWKKNFIQVKEYCIYFLLLEIFLILSFAALDLISFFIFFESILIPMFFIVGIWGSRERRIRAAFLLFLYTLFGSIFLFFSLLILFFDVGTTSFSVLSKISIDLNKQLVLWLFVFLAFSVKIPTIPLHIWLPEAHVEAPTSGSVILAGLLLKLGGYGLIRVLLPIFSEATIFYLPITDTFALVSIIYASFTTIRQMDLKRIIAYSSVAHMNLVVLGIFSGNIQGISGSIFLMIAHGIVSSALFFLIGVVYDKYGTRLLYYYGGLAQTMPMFTVQLLIFCMANIGLPGTCNFVGELVVFCGLIDRNFFVFLIAVTGVVLSVLYTIFMFNRCAFGNLNTSYIAVYRDMTKREYYTIVPLTILTILLGLFPDLIFDTMLTSVSMVVENSKLI